MQRVVGLADERLVEQAERDAALVGHDDEPEAAAGEQAQRVDGRGERGVRRSRLSRYPASSMRVPSRSRNTAGARAVTGRMVSRIRQSATLTAPHGPELARLRGDRRLRAGADGVRHVLRPLPAVQQGLLPHRPFGAVVGHLLHHRRDRDQHASRSSACPRRPTPATWRSCSCRSATSSAASIVSALFLPGVLPRRPDDVVPAARAAVRPGSAVGRRGDLPGDAIAGRRHPAVRDGARHRGGHRHPGALDGHPARHAR